MLNRIEVLGNLLGWAVLRPQKFPDAKLIWNELHYLTKVPEPYCILEVNSEGGEWSVFKWTATPPYKGYYKTAHSGPISPTQAASMDALLKFLATVPSYAVLSGHLQPSGEI